MVTTTRTADDHNQVDTNNQREVDRSIDIENIIINDTSNNDKTMERQ